MKDCIYFIKNNSIIILSILIFTTFTILYALFREPSSDQYTTVLSSEKKNDKNNTAENKEYTGNNPKEASDIKYISELFKSNPSKFKNIVIKKYTIIKESSDYRVAEMTVHNNSTKKSYTERILFKGPTIISGIITYHRTEYLKAIGIPSDIITLYMKRGNNV